MNKSEEQFEIFVNYAKKLYELEDKDYKKFKAITNEEIRDYFKKENINFYLIFEYMSEEQKEDFIYYYFYNTSLRFALRTWYEDYKRLKG
jgi:hypothetical protein